MTLARLGLRPHACANYIVRMASGSARRNVLWLLLNLAVVVLILLVGWPKISRFVGALPVRDIEAGPLLVRDASGESVLATLVSYEQSRWSRNRSGRGRR